MFSPSKLLASQPTNKNALKGYFSNATGAFTKSILLNEVELSETTSDWESRFRSLVPRLISNYQKAKIRDLDNLRIDVHMKARSDTKQLPQPPKTLDYLPDYVFNLASILNYELTRNNRDKKQKIFDSLNAKVEDLKTLNDGNQILLKSILLNSIIQKQSISNIFDKLQFDVDVFYILCFKYFMNPFSLDRESRFLDLVKTLKKYNGKVVIDRESWTFLDQLITTNMLSVNTNFKSYPSGVFSQMIRIVDDVDSYYNDFNLLGMLRVLRNAETGFERVADNDVIKFDIGYYRYIIIDRALCEWNKDSLTLDTWQRYDFGRQWKSIWEVYYESHKSVRPGGPTTMKHVYNLISSSS